ncbi:MAG: elongation factor Ts, partial [Bacteroidales bacterium]|nr:elongation factor Ts [Bacteroidales bacterium]
FQNLAEAIADVAIAQCPADLEGLKACKMADGYTVEEAVEAQTGKTGEKHVLVGYALVEAPFVAQYIHKITGKLGALVGFNKEVPAELAKGIVMQVASMNPVAISAEDCPQEVIDSERNVAIQKTKDELVKKAVDAALTKAGINPAHVDSEDHIESNTAKGWLTPEQAQQAREIIKTVGEQKAANLPEQMVQNIANGRVQKFFKESTLEEQDFVQSDEKVSVAQYIKKVDAEAKVLSFKRFSLSD